MPNVLTVRSPYRDQPLREHVACRGSLQDLRAPRLLVLVHGYNNDEVQAASAYATFQRRLRSALLEPPSRMPRPIWEYHWPGDDRRWSVSLLGYPIKPAVATTSGERLGEFLATLARTQVVDIVAHSLGCRVALATTAWIKRQPSYQGARIGQVVLMAAAVPEHLCRDQDGRPFRRPLPTEAEHVLHSRADLVLRLVFRRGQGVAGEGGSPAVGRNGGPAGRWSSVVDSGVGHTAYWGSADVARAVATATGWRRARAVATRQVAAGYLAPTRGQGRRAVTQRRVSSRAV
ncbi:MAG TPA: alpha/beta hydrolase [Frankiaceae bacterium]|jgi:hypothetical protein|nr:alpha/beta hydrolase [Frankiaceae bacterium]